MEVDDPNHPGGERNPELGPSGTGTGISWWPDNNRKYYGKDWFFSAGALESNARRHWGWERAKAPYDWYFQIKGLDEAAIVDWFNNFKKGNGWQTLGNNCSSVAYQALRHGGAQFALPKFWMPSLVAKYLQDFARHMTPGMSISGGSSHPE